MNDKFKQFMNDQPFDDINLNLDSKYFDIGVGYNKQKGTTVSATIDLNSVGQIDENQLIREKIQLEREKLEFAKLQYQNNLERSYKPVVEVKPKEEPVQPKPVYHEEPLHQPIEFEESSYENCYGLNAKAFIEEE